jgi:hypothetical protein
VAVAVKAGLPVTDSQVTGALKVFQSVERRRPSAVAEANPRLLVAVAVKAGLPVTDSQVTGAANADQSLLRRNPSELVEAYVKFEEYVKLSTLQNAAVPRLLARMLLQLSAPSMATARESPSTAKVGTTVVPGGSAANLVSWKSSNRPSATYLNASEPEMRLRTDSVRTCVDASKNQDTKFMR